MTTPADAALALAVEHGLKIVPLAGKVPTIAHGFREASANPDTVTEWMQHPGVTGYGLVPASARLLGIDCDSSEDQQFLQRLGAFAVPTWIVQTGRADGTGCHVYFTMPRDLDAIGNLSLRGTGDCKVRCTDGYLVGPGSGHPSGGTYTTLQGAPNAVAALPPALETLLRSKLNGNGKASPQAVVPEQIGEGQRNATLTSLAGTMRRRGMSEEAIGAALTAENAARCTPPLPEADVAAIAHSIRRYEPEPAPGPLIPRSEAPTPEPFPTVRVLEGTAPEPPGVLVDSLLVDRDLNLWAGHGGAFKTVVALHAAVCVPLGRPVFGTLAVRRPGPVLLACPEDGRAAVRMMLDAIIAGMDLDATDRATLTDRLHLISDDSLVSLSTDTRRLMRTAQAHGAVLVLLDPLRNLLGGADENDNAIAGLCLDVLRRDLCREAGAAVLLNAHTRKPGKDSGPDTSATVHELRGASAWAAGARLVFGVTNKAGHVTLTALKANRLRSDLRHELRLDIDADPSLATRWRSVTVIDANSGASSDAFTPFFGRRLNANERAALRVLEDEPDTALSWSQWSKRSGLIERTFTNTKSRLTRAGLAESLPTTKRAVGGGFVHVYRISNTGRNALLGEAAE